MCVEMPGEKHKGENGRRKTGAEEQGRQLYEGRIRVQPKPWTGGRPEKRRAGRGKGGVAGRG